MSWSLTKTNNDALLKQREAINKNIVKWADLNASYW